MLHCVLWQASDWQFALMTIEIAALVDDREAIKIYARAGKIEWRCRYRRSG
jgi:hypothetical protein